MPGPDPPPPIQVSRECLWYEHSPLSLPPHHVVALAAIISVTVSCAQNLNSAGPIERTLPAFQNRLTCLLSPCCGTRNTSTTWQSGGGGGGGGGGSEVRNALVAKRRNVPRSHESVGTWVNRQREAYKKGKLSEGHFQMQDIPDWELVDPRGIPRVHERHVAHLTQPAIRPLQGLGESRTSGYLGDHSTPGIQEGQAVRGTYPKAR